MRTNWLFLTVLIASLFFLLPSLTSAAPYDTGMIIWYQPDSSSFNGRSWGDEFLNWRETESGYAFVRDGNEYFCYAALDENGEYTATQYVVGTDSPPPASYHLQRSSARMAEIEEEIEEFNLQVQQQLENHLALQAQLDPDPVTYHLYILLVDFTDYTHLQGSGYLASCFTDQLITDDTYNSTAGAISPNNEDVYGSMRDYFEEQSLNEVIIEGELVNPLVGGYPTWVHLDNTKTYYDTYNLIISDAIAEAAEELQWVWDPGISDRLGIIYAYDRWDNKLRPTACNNIYVMSEQISVNNFANIGTHMHEFGHTIGMSDQYNTPIDPNNWCSRSYGCYNGDQIGFQMNHTCPASLNPFWRAASYGWIQMTEITQNIDDLDISYNYNDPIVYKIQCALSEEYFILENRQRTGFDAKTPWFTNCQWTPPVPPTGEQGGLLIWHINPSGGVDLYDMEEADGNLSQGGDNGDPYPITTNNSFTPSSTPNSNLMSDPERSSHVAITNITWNNPVITVNIALNVGLEIIEENTVWDEDMLITCDYLFRNGAQLTIEPGVTVSFQAAGAGEEKFGLYFEDGASLVAEGTTEQPIVFTSNSINPEVGDYSGLIFSDDAFSQLDYCNFSYGDCAIGISESSNASDIDNCSFSDCSKAINMEDCEYTIQISQIDAADCGYGVTASNVDNISITNSDFSDIDFNAVDVDYGNDDFYDLEFSNVAGIALSIIGTGDVFDCGFNSCGIGLSHCAGNVYNCEVSNCNIGFANCGASSISDCIFTNCVNGIETDINISETFTLKNSIIDGNLITDAIGLDCGGQGSHIVINLIINEFDISIYQSDNNEPYPTCYISNCILSQNNSHNLIEGYYQPALFIKSSFLEKQCVLCICRDEPTARPVIWTRRCLVPTLIM